MSGCVSCSSHDSLWIFLISCCLMILLVKCSLGCGFFEIFFEGGSIPVICLAMGSCILRIHVENLIVICKTKF